MTRSQARNSAVSKRGQNYHNLAGEVTTAVDSSNH